MSFESDLQEILFLLVTDKERREHDLKIINECLFRMRNAYKQNLQAVTTDDSNGTRPEDWKR